METKLPIQISDPEHIRSILRIITKQFSVDEIQPDTLLVYLPCSGENCDHSKLFEAIEHSLMSSFALSYSEIKEKTRTKKTKEEIFSKAIRKISTHTAKGELGELLLFTLLEVYFNAPKILTKISLKTSRRVPVFGADAVHAQFINGKIRLYLGEAKLYKNFSNAASEAIKSIKNTINNYEDEFDLIETHMDFPGISPDQKEALLNFMNPFSNSSALDKNDIHTPCFIGFVEKDIFTEIEKNYIEQYTQVAEKHVSDFYKKLMQNGHPHQTTALLLLPFSSLKDLVNGFISHMGIKK